MIQIDEERMILLFTLNFTLFNFFYQEDTLFLPLIDNSFIYIKFHIVQFLLSRRYFILLLPLIDNFKNILIKIIHPNLAHKSLEHE